MFKNYIAGEWVDGNDVSVNINPSDTNDVIGEFARASADDVNKAVEAAQTGAAKWALSTAAERHTVLSHIAKAMYADLDQLGTELSREQGKTLAEGKGEALRAAQLFDFYAGEALRMEGLKVPSIRDGVEIEVTREPVGIVGIIAPWNYPLAIPAWKIAPALACGNAVIFKPADLVTHSAYLLAQIIASSGLPEGVFNLTMGRGSLVGEAMLNHPYINAISFTGSQSIGLHAAQACTAKMPLKKVQLELGGKNPLIVLDDADLDLAVATAVNGAYFGTGQRCTASSRLIVTESIHDRFVEAMKVEIGKLKVDHALKEDSTIGPVVDEAQMKQDIEYVDLGRREGANLVMGGGGS